MLIRDKEAEDALLFQPTIVLQWNSEARQLNGDQFLYSLTRL